MKGELKVVCILSSDPSHPQSSLEWLELGTSNLVGRVSKYAHTQPFYGPLSGTTRVSRYQKKHSPTHLS